MADITLRGNPFHTSGDLPAVGSQAPHFVLDASDKGVHRELVSEIANEPSYDAALKALG